MAEPPKTLAGRLGWMFFIWAASIAVLGLLAWLIRLVLL